MTDRPNASTPEEQRGHRPLVSRLRAGQWLPLVIHLRLPFQLVLAPVFLWGYLLNGGPLALPLAAAFIAFHVFLYGGVTAFNSYYDRDEGPVGGLEKPPPVTAPLLPFSLVMQAIGLVIVSLLSKWLVLVYLDFAALSFAYSHPSVRLKSHPLTAVLAVGLGQGFLGFLAGWLATGADLPSVLAPLPLLGALTAALLILGFYVLSGLYQIEEDEARGDRTVAVAWGPGACLALSLACQLLGGALMVFLVYSRFGVQDAALVALGLSIQVGLVCRWGYRFLRKHQIPGYRGLMRANQTSAGLLGLYLAGRLILGAFLTP